jgi:molybdenum cofactor cytidylyltransferase
VPATVTIVILAAGAARRMGRQKLILHVDGQPMVSLVIEAAGAWPTLVVAGDEVACLLGPAASHIVRNDTPERGMSYSLLLAHRCIAAAEPIAVLLGDLPDITHAAIERVIAAYDATVDVVIPRCGQTAGHPVVFGPRARRKIAHLPEGDTIRLLRDDPALRRRIVQTGPAALCDIDTPSDYSRRLERGAAES